MEPAPSEVRGEDVALLAASEEERERGHRRGPPHGPHSEIVRPRGQRAHRRLRVRFRIRGQRGLQGLPHGLGPCPNVQAPAPSGPVRAWLPTDWRSGLVQRIREGEESVGREG